MLGLRKDMVHGSHGYFAVLYRRDCRDPLSALHPWSLPAKRHGICFSETLGRVMDFVRNQKRLQMLMPPPGGKRPPRASGPAAEKIGHLRRCFLH